MSTKTVRLGRLLASEDWIEVSLLRAKRSVLSRGDNGKLPSTVMSLSVKSMASCGYYNISTVFSKDSSNCDGEKDLRQRQRDFQ